MTIISKSHYLIHENNSNLSMQIIFEKNEHKIFYQIFKNDDWTEKKLLDDKAFSDFNLIQLTNSNLYLLYKDLEHNIILTQYKNNTWTTEVLVQNNSKNLKFIPLEFKEKLFIFFQNYTKDTNTTYLFYQILEDNLTLSSPTLIDKVNFKNNLLDAKPLNDSIYIFYFNFKLNYLLGFKKLDFKNKKLTSFQTLSTFENLESNYTITVNENIFLIQCEKEDQDNEADTKEIIEKNNIITDENFELFDNSAIDHDSKEIPDLPPNAKTIQISNLTRENINLQRENSLLKRKLEMANKRLTLFYNQLSKFLE